MKNDLSQTIFNCPCRLSISMFLQNISPIGLFITMLGLTERFFEEFYSNNSRKNDRTKTIFYLDLKHVHKYGSAKFQPNPLFSSQQMGTEHASGRKKKNVCKPIGDPVGTGCPNY